MPLLDLKSPPFWVLAEWLGRAGVALQSPADSSSGLPLPLPPAGPPIDHVGPWHVARAIGIHSDHLLSSHQKKKRNTHRLCITFRPACRLPAGRASGFRHLHCPARGGITSNAGESLAGSLTLEQPAAQSPASASPVLSPSFLIHPLVRITSLC